MGQIEYTIAWRGVAVSFGRIIIPYCDRSTSEKAPYFHCSVLLTNMESEVNILATLCWTGTCKYINCTHMIQLTDMCNCIVPMLFSRIKPCVDSIFYDGAIHNTISWVQPAVRIRVKIGPPHPHACRRRRLIGAVVRMRTEKNQVQCHSRCGTIKIPPSSKALSAKHRPKFHSPSPAKVTSHISEKFLSGT
jgi:hypothetical protein